MKITVRMALGVLLLAALGPGAQGQARMYGISDSCGCCCGPPEIWAIDPVDASMTLLATLPQTLVALAQHPQTGMLYAVSNVGTNPVYLVDPSDGSYQKLYDGGNLQWHRYGFDPSGRLWGVPLNSNSLYEIDPATGQETLIGTLTVPRTGWWGDIVFPPGELDGFWYGHDMGFYWVDLATLQATLIRWMPFGISGMSVTEDGRLYFASDWDLYEIDPTTGADSYRGPFAHTQVLDMSGCLPPLYLDVDPDVLNPGDTVTLTARQGAPGQVVSLFLTSLDGVPTFRPLLFRRFDGAGQWSLTTSSPALRGITLGLTSFGFTASGRLQRTNEEDVTLQ